MSALDDFLRVVVNDCVNGTTYLTCGACGTVVETATRAHFWPDSNFGCETDYYLNAHDVALDPVTLERWTPPVPPGPGWDDPMPGAA